MTLTTQDPDAQTPLLEHQYEIPCLSQPATASSEDKDEIEIPVPTPSSKDKDETETETPQVHKDNTETESPSTGEKTEKPVIPRFMTPDGVNAFVEAHDGGGSGFPSRQNRKALYAEKEKVAQAFRDAIKKDAKLAKEFSEAKIAGKECMKAMKDGWNTARASRSQYKHVWPIVHIST